jgi:hypothetical protein
MRRWDAGRIVQLCMDRYDMQILGQVLLHACTSLVTQIAFGYRLALQEMAFLQQTLPTTGSGNALFSGFG